MRVDLADSVRRFWDADAATYDRSPDHGAATPTERAAWSAALARLLPPAPARVLDAGAGTGFLSLEAVEGGAEHPPPGQFDAVIERHLLWTLPDPAAALTAWRQAAPEGRLVLFEGLWGRVDPIERLRQQAREGWRRLRREPDHHHGHYDAELVAELPLATGAHPDEFIRLVEQAGWGPARMERLRDVEWAQLLALPPANRLLGVVPRLAISAGA